MLGSGDRVFLGSRLLSEGASPVDFEYLMRRMTEERERAAEADSDAARDAHNALAEQYAAEIARLHEGGGPELGLAQQ